MKLLLIFQWRNRTLEVVENAPFFMQQDRKERIEVRVNKEWGL